MQYRLSEVTAVTSESREHIRQRNTLGTHMIMSHSPTDKNWASQALLPSNRQTFENKAHRCMNVSSSALARCVGEVDCAMQLQE